MPYSQCRCSLVVLPISQHTIRLSRWDRGHQRQRHKSARTSTRGVMGTVTVPVAQ